MRADRSTAALGCLNVRSLLHDFDDVVEFCRDRRICVRVVVRRFSAIIVVLYRPGSAAVQQRFFDELSAVLDRFAIYQEPIFLVGDFNIRLDRVEDPHANQLRSLIDSYGLKLHATGPTHRRGGTLDAVITRDDAGCPECVAVDDVGISDHFLLRWEVSTIREESSMLTVRSRPWRRLDIDLFRSALSTSQLCLPLTWPTDIDEMAALYDSQIYCLLDQLLPERQFVRRPRPSDPHELIITIM
jgi:hypothetical protein